MLALLPSTAMPLHSPGPALRFPRQLARERDANAARGRKQANENAYIILHSARKAVSLPMDYIAPRVSGSGQKLPPPFVYGTVPNKHNRGKGKAAGTRVAVRRE